MCPSEQGIQKFCQPDSHLCHLTNVPRLERMNAGKWPSPSLKETACVLSVSVLLLKERHYLQNPHERKWRKTRNGAGLTIWHRLLPISFHCGYNNADLKSSETQLKEETVGRERDEERRERGDTPSTTTQSVIESLSGLRSLSPSRLPPFTITEVKPCKHTHRKWGSMWVMRASCSSPFVCDHRSHRQRRTARISLTQPIFAYFSDCHKDPPQVRSSAPRRYTVQT